MYIIILIEGVIIIVLLLICVCPELLGAGRSGGYTRQFIGGGSLPFTFVCSTSVNVK